MTDTLDGKPLPNPLIKVGAYDKLSKDDKAIVDSILVSDVLGKARIAERDPTTATPEQLMAETMLLAAQNPTKPSGFPNVSKLMESQLEVGRDYYAVDKGLLQAVRQHFRENGIPKEELRKFTTTANSMIAVDGDQFQVQRDLPQVVDPQSPALKR